MSSAKPATKPEKTRNECKLLAEVAGLKENNRELAKSLAEKRKENIELREMQNKYAILENKFKINQKMHLSSISRLETFLMQTSSQLFDVVESISCMHKTLHESMRRSLTLGDSDRKKENVVLKEKTLLSEDTRILEHVSDMLKNITSKNQFNALDKQEMNTLSPQRTSEEYTEKTIECTPRELDPLPEVENNFINDLGEDCNLCEAQKLTQNKSDIYTSWSQKTHNLDIVSSEEFIDDRVSSKPTNKDFSSGEESQLDETETTFLYLNGAQRVSDVSPIVTSIGTDTYHYSQDEEFQNFLADDETIIRRGVDRSLACPCSHEIPLISVDTKQVQHICEANENMLRTTNTSTKVEHRGNKQQSESLIISVNVSTHSTNFANPSNTKEVKNLIKLDAIEQRGRNYPIILQNPITRNAKMRTSCKYFTEVANTEERHYTKLFNASPRREEKHNYSQCFTNSNFLQSLEQHKGIFNKTARRSGESNDYTIYSDSTSPNADTEKYLRRYKTLVNLNDFENLKDSKNESCSGKENTHSLTKNKEFRQTIQGKEFSRKPFQDRRNAFLSGVEHMFCTFKKRDEQDSLGDGKEHTLCSKELLSQNTNEDTTKINSSKKNITKKSRKKPRLRKKENLRL